jgi:hypothetical protein
MWVALALSAGLLQSGRNAFARSLSGRTSPALNSWARFAFNLLNPRVGTGRFEVAAHTLFHVTWMEVVLLFAGIVLVLVSGARP